VRPLAAAPSARPSGREDRVRRFSSWCVLTWRPHSHGAVVPKGGLTFGSLVCPSSGQAITIVTDVVMLRSSSLPACGRTPSDTSGTTSPSCAAASSASRSARCAGVAVWMARSDARRHTSDLNSISSRALSVTMASAIERSPCSTLSLRIHPAVGQLLARPGRRHRWVVDWILQPQGRGARLLLTQKGFDIENRRQKMVRNAMERSWKRVVLPRLGEVIPPPT
jgi:hypothetical protein